MDLTEKAVSRTLDFLFNLFMTVTKQPEIGFTTKTVDPDGLLGSNCTLNI